MQNTRWNNPVRQWLRYIKRNPAAYGFLFLGLGIGELFSWWLVRDSNVAAAQPALTTFGVAYLIIGIMFFLRQKRTE